MARDGRLVQTNMTSLSVDLLFPLFITYSLKGRFGLSLKPPSSGCVIPHPFLSFDGLGEPLDVSLDD